MQGDSGATMDCEQMVKMMQHMQSGDMGAMSDCPMMKAMQGAGESAEPEKSSEHSEHH